MTIKPLLVTTGAKTAIFGDFLKYWEILGDFFTAILHSVHIIVTGFVPRL